MTDKMDEAVRIGCRAADMHLDCFYPTCTCKKLPAAIKAAVTFALRDAAKTIRHA